MRFFVFATLGLVAFATAQSSTSDATGTTAAATSSPSLDAQTQCLQGCGSTDVCCQAACVNVPCPDQTQVNATTQCAAQCPQGNGTASETQEYADCQASCVSSYFLSSASATATSSGAAASDTGAAATTTGSSPSGSGSSASSGASGSASATGTSDNGAEGLHVGAAGLGFLGLVIAGLAL